MAWRFCAACAQMRERSYYPVLILTAKGQREDRDRALSSGANLFMTKPFSNAEVIAAVIGLAHGVPP
jgi:DNA-binding response OmpR family regulator